MVALGADVACHAVCTIKFDQTHVVSALHGLVGILKAHAHFCAKRTNVVLLLRLITKGFPFYMSIVTKGVADGFERKPP